MSKLLYEQCVAVGALSEFENLRVYKGKKIFENSVQNVISQDNPVAIILGGQNASGKSTLGKQFLKEYQNAGGIAKVESDALREYHPLFLNFIRDNEKMMPAYTAKDCGRWTRRLIEDLGRNRCNMLIETTMRSLAVVCETVQRLHEGGYNVQINAFIVCYDKSLAGCFKRYEDMKVDGFGRFVHDHSLNVAYQGMPETLQALKDQNLATHIHLYTREQPLFVGDYRTTDIVKLVNQERRREFTPDEIKFLSTQWKETSTMMLARGAGKDEYLEVAIRMKNRIHAMISEKYPQKNISTAVNIYHEFNRTVHQAMGISKGIAF
jgi:UDP-N-acetylglucosamine kinase